MRRFQKLFCTDLFILKAECTTINISFDSVFHVFQELLEYLSASHDFSGQEIRAGAHDWSLLHGVWGPYLGVA